MIGANWWRARRPPFELGFAALGALRLARNAGAVGRTPAYRVVAPALAGADDVRERPRRRYPRRRDQTASGPPRRRRPGRRCRTRETPAPRRDGAHSSPR